MTPEPREREDYGVREVEAARRVLVDVGQVLASFEDCLVVVGGWAPDLLLREAEEPHIGSIDVDLALDAAKLNDGRYAEILKLMLDTRRYRMGPEHFQLVTTVDLGDGEIPVQVTVDFLAPKDVRLGKNRPKLLPGFRVLQVASCGLAFRAPVELEVAGLNVEGAENTVRLRVASLEDWLVMKAQAIGNRDKPKDVYDLCYGLRHAPGGVQPLAESWQPRATEKEVAKAITILREKFTGVNALGPRQLVGFHHEPDRETRAIQARGAYAIVQSFLRYL